MTNLALVLYFADRIYALITILILLAIAIVVFMIWQFLGHCYAKADVKLKYAEHKKLEDYPYYNWNMWPFRIALVFILLFIVLIPSPKTIYLISGISVSDKIISNPDVTNELKELYQGIKNKIIN